MIDWNQITPIVVTTLGTLSTPFIGWATALIIKKNAEAKARTASINQEAAFQRLNENNIILDNAIDIAVKSVQQTYVKGLKKQRDLQQDTSNLSAISNENNPEVINALDVIGKYLGYKISVVPLILSAMSIGATSVWNEETKKIAFNTAKNKVLNSLSSQVKKDLEQVYPNLDDLINDKIEAHIEGGCI